MTGKLVAPSGTYYMWQTERDRRTEWQGHAAQKQSYTKYYVYVKNSI